MTEDVEVLQRIPNFFVQISLDKLLGNLAFRELIFLSLIYGTGLQK